MFESYEDIDPLTVSMILAITGFSEIRQVPLEDINGFMDMMQEVELTRNFLDNYQNDESV